MTKHLVFFAVEKEVEGRRRIRAGVFIIMIGACDLPHIFLIPRIIIRIALDVLYLAPYFFKRADFIPMPFGNADIPDIVMSQMQNNAIRARADNDAQITVSKQCAFKKIR